MITIHKGLIISPKNRKKLTVFSAGYMAVSADGKILEVGKKDLRKKYPGARLEDHSGKLICPGFVDTHNHLPQYAFAGIGDKELLPWLKKYTFPQETAFSDDKVARESAKRFFADLLANGTTTTTTYITVHKSATEIAFEEAEKSGIRAVIGKVMMDQNSPRALTENTEKSLRESEELIDKWHGRDGRLFYAITPRFAVSCSRELLKKAAKIAHEKDTYIQTHLAENTGEIAFVKKLFPASRTYTDVYRQTGMLGPKTIMAHCVHLSEKEIGRLKKTGTKVAHCPCSNNFLASGIMPYRRYERKGLTVGLGTDVAGGYTLSMLNEMKEAIENSKYASLFLQRRNAPPVTPVEAFYLATLGGAKVLSMDNRIGSLEKGKQADFLVIDFAATDPSRGSTSYSKPEQILSRLIYRGHQSNIKHAFIGGRKIF